MENASAAAKARHVDAGKADEKQTTVFDYAAAAELFPTRTRSGRLQPVGYKRFTQAAEAIRFAIEDLSPQLLVGAYLEVDEERFDGAAIRRLYDSPRYPLVRRSAKQAGKVRP